MCLARKNTRRHYGITRCSRNGKIVVQDVRSNLIGFVVSTWSCPGTKERWRHDVLWCEPKWWFIFTSNQYWHPSCPPMTFLFVRHMCDAPRFKSSLKLERSIKNALINYSLSIPFFHFIPFHSIPLFFILIFRPQFLPNYFVFRFSVLCVWLCHVFFSS